MTRLQERNEQYDQDFLELVQVNVRLMEQIKLLKQRGKKAIIVCQGLMEKKYLFSR